MKNQIILNAPQLPKGFKWQIEGYLYGKNTRQCPLKFEEFSHLQWISKSNGMHHFLGDFKRVLICSIQIS